jgi:hypothetical protein
MFRDSFNGRRFAGPRWSMQEYNQARLFFICHGLLAEVECTHNSFNDILRAFVKYNVLPSIFVEFYWLDFINIK